MRFFILIFTLRKLVGCGEKRINIWLHSKQNGPKQGALKLKLFSDLDLNIVLKMPMFLRYTSLADFFMKFVVRVPSNNSFYNNFL